MLKNIFGVVVFVLVGWIVTGCSSVMVPVGESSSTRTAPQQQSSSTTKPQSESTVKSAPESADTNMRQPTGNAIVPNSREQNLASGSAVKKLLQDAWAYHRTGQYDRSNAVAERAMRIDHTDPDIYWVMASNYLALAQLNLAEQLAIQGLPLADSDGAVKRGLQQLLSEIRAKIP